MDQSITRTGPIPESHAAWIMCVTFIRYDIMGGRYDVMGGKSAGSTRHYKEKNTSM